MCRLFFADEYARHTEGTPSASQTPNMESAFQAVQNALPKLENRVIEFLAEWLVALLAPARHVLETRSPHLSFMLLKEYWFRELYLGLKVTASFDRTSRCCFACVGCFLVCLVLCLCVFVFLCFVCFWCFCFVSFVLG